MELSTRTRSIVGSKHSGSEIPPCGPHGQNTMHQLPGTISRAEECVSRMADVTTVVTRGEPPVNPQEV
jgi:hypothetical protein